MAGTIHDHNSLRCSNDVAGIIVIIIVVRTKEFSAPLRVALVHGYAILTERIKLRTKNETVEKICRYELDEITEDKIYDHTSLIA